MTASTHVPSTRSFGSEGARVILTPVRAPKANAFAERWVRTVRAEVLDWTIILGRRHLDRVLATYVEHYNSHRPHRGLDLACPSAPLPNPAGPPTGDTRRRDVLGASSTSTTQPSHDGNRVSDPHRLSRRNERRSKQPSQSSPASPSQPAHCARGAEQQHGPGRHDDDRPVSALGLIVGVRSGRGR